MMADGFEIVIGRSPLDEKVEIYKRKERCTEIDSKEYEPKKVAAYCRVSKNIELMQTSLKTQSEAFQRIISERLDWEFAGIYFDNGISGMSVKKRHGFLKMIEDCKQGKIDIILAKSISRFARNTVDTLKYIRMLRDLGVTVHFEKERINTADLVSEMLLSVYAAFAQEESHSISENVKRGLRQRFLTGTVKYSKVYGYYPDPKDRTIWHINEDEAAVIREIYRKFIHGDSLYDIKRGFTKEGVPAPERGKWYASSILVMLKNERYTGDLLMQKTVIVDVLNHIAKKNDGIAPQYMKKDHHPAIVSREDFGLVQRMILLRNYENGYHQYPYYDYMWCPKCGKQMVQFLNLHPRYPACWICVDHKNCSSLFVMNRYVDDAVRKAIIGLDSSIDGFKEHIEEAQRHLLARGNIELCHLRNLVERIEIIDDYMALRITFQFGKQYEYRIKFIRPSDHPFPRLRTKTEPHI